jgi:hypothetical protein
MAKRVLLGGCLAILIAAEWNVESLAQALPQGRAMRPQVKAAIPTPCVGRESSIECAIYRLDQVDRRLDHIEALLDRQSGSGRNTPSGSPIDPLGDPGGKSDANSDYIQERIDALSKSVRELIDRVNKL